MEVTPAAGADASNLSPMIKEVKSDEVDLPDAGEDDREATGDAPSAAVKPEPATKSTKVGRWNAADDLLLKDSLQVLHEFDKVAKTIKFSVKVTAKELEERWKQLLYDDKVAVEAVEAMAGVSSQSRRVLWGEEEEALLKREALAPGFSGFQAVLERNRAVFHSSRTAKSLETHYYRMKRGSSGTANPTDPSSTAPPPTEEGDGEHEEQEKKDSEVERLSTLNFVDVETEVAREKLPSGPVPVREDRMHRRILMAEREYEHEREKERDSKSLAMLRGLRVRYPMRTREILIGRDSSDGRVDLNLLEEDPVEGMRASRRHAVVRMKSDGEFHLKVLGKRPVFVNGQPVLPGTKRKLPDSAVLELVGLKLVFEPNKSMQTKIRRQLQQQSSSTSASL